jgi:K+-sensing histidine kinase KdpD
MTTRNEVLDLVAYLVHDLKSPLATILSNLHLISQVMDDPKGDELIKQGRQAAERMERMILNLLDLGRLDDGLLELKPVEVPLDDLVDEAIVAVRPLADGRSVSLEIGLGDLAQRLVSVDFDLMTRVLINLLENAIRHTPQETAVSIRAVAENGGFALYVEDEGHGVPEADREWIFDKFARQRTNGSHRTGTGLGLAFSKLVAEAHSIDVGVCGREGQGSRFFLRFPGEG